MLGLLRKWQAVESWAAAAKLGVLRALIREDDEPLPGGGYHGDLPDGWTKSLTAHVCAGAKDYQDSGAFPEDTRMDQYRAAAYLDLLNGIHADARIAVGHGCARPQGKPKAGTTGSAAADSNPPPGTHSVLALPARVNLTITADCLAELRAAGPPGTSAPRGSSDHARWSFTSTGDPGPPGGYGAWTITLPGGSQLTLDLGPVPPSRATTGTSRTPTSPTTPSATWSRSATTSAPSRPARATPGNRISSTPSPTTKAVRPARATPAPAAGPATR
jgi:hypothetical protein